jgi:hypothetical protein
MSVVDLPHQKTDVSSLGDQARSLCETFADHASDARKRGGLKLKVLFNRKGYGAKVRILWLPPEYCKCADPKCKDRRYFLCENAFRVKDDFGLVALENFLESQKQFARQFVPPVNLLD